MSGSDSNSMSVTLEPSSATHFPAAVIVVAIQFPLIRTKRPEGSSSSIHINYSWVVGVALGAINELIILIFKCNGMPCHRRRKWIPIFFHSPKSSGQIQK